MVNGISTNAASYVGGSTQTDQVQRTQATTSTQSTTKAAAPQADSVKLSPTAEAKVMLHQGMSVNQIAARLGESVQVVSGLLGITTTPASVPVAAQEASLTKK